MCDRFKCLPSQLLAESAELVQLITIDNLGNGVGEEVDDGEW